MNFIDFHLGDYEAATAHLTALEDGIYGRLIRIYYRTERPLPVEVRQIYRLARALSKPERDAVDQVLAEFFELRDDGWHQDRCDAEIERYQAGEPEREIKKANEDNRLKRHREERAKLFKVVTDAGLHAAWNVPMNELRDLAKRCSPPLPDTEPATAPATPATATQYPVPSTQKELLPDEADASSSSPGATRGRAEAVPECPYDTIVAAYHQALPMLPRVRLMDEKRKALMRKRWAWVLRSNRADGTRRATTSDEAVAWLRDYFARAALNAWLTGQQPSRTHPDWKADLEFLLKDAGLKAVIERTEVPA